MPELPEVETVRKGLAPVFEGAVIASVEQNRPNLRFPFPENFTGRLKDNKVERLERRAKYLLAHLKSREILIMHLGMSGRFVIDENGKKKKPGNFVHQAGAPDRPNSNRANSNRHDHVIFHMKSGTVIRYNDARRFGFMMLIDEAEKTSHKLLSGLGIEPLSEDLTAEFLAQKAYQKTTSLKAFLLDQSIIAGLGNIYVCEALFRVGLSPKREASVLVTKTGKATVKTQALIRAIQDVLREAIAAGGSSLKDHRQTDGSLGYFQHSFSVYGREGAMCVTDRCSGVVQRIAQNGRSSFYCPVCQK